MAKTFRKSNRDNNSYKPIKIRKNKLKKNMKLGNKISSNIFIFFCNKFFIAEQKITTSPLLNIDKIKPSFEELDEEIENIRQIKI